jgi:hypothetical protein
MKRAKSSNRKGASCRYRWLPTKSIPYVFIAIVGITSANINNSKYLYIIEGDGVDDVVPEVVVLAALWILNPKINDDIPIKKETTARIFPVTPGMITIGNPWLVCGCCCCCCSPAAGFIDTKKNTIKRFGNNL